MKLCTSTSTGTKERDIAMLLIHCKTVWPSGLRRWLQAPVRKGMGSNPTAVIYMFCDLPFEIEVTNVPYPLYCELHSLDVCVSSVLNPRVRSTVDAPKAIPASHTMHFEAEWRIKHEHHAKILKNAKTVWPSGLRRWLQAPVRKGVGSNPTAVIVSPVNVMGNAILTQHVATLNDNPLHHTIGPAQALFYKLS